MPPRLTFDAVIAIQSSLTRMSSLQQVARPRRKWRCVTPALVIGSLAQQPTLTVFIGDHRQTPGGLSKGRVAAVNRRKLLQRPLGVRALDKSGDYLPPVRMTAGIILPNSSRVSMLTYQATVAVRYPESVLHEPNHIYIGHFVPHESTVAQRGFRTDCGRRLKIYELQSRTSLLSALI